MLASQPWKAELYMWVGVCVGECECAVLLYSTCRIPGRSTSTEKEKQIYYL